MNPFGLADWLIGKLAFWKTHLSPGIISIPSASFSHLNSSLGLATIGFQPYMALGATLVPPSTSAIPIVWETTMSSAGISQI